MTLCHKMEGWKLNDEESGVNRVLDSVADTAVCILADSFPGAMCCKALENPIELVLRHEG